MSATTVHPNPQKSSITLTTRAIDAVDRAHARAAAALHGVRNGVRDRLERAIERAERLTTTAFERARHGIERADHASADAVNRAQGVVNHALDVARESRVKPQHLPS